MLNKMLGLALFLIVGAFFGCGQNETAVASLSTQESNIWDPWCATNCDWTRSCADECISSKASDCASDCATKRTSNLAPCAMCYKLTGNDNY